MNYVSFSLGKFEYCEIDKVFNYSLFRSGFTDFFNSFE